MSDFAREKNIESIEFIKIDTEGHDVAVLEGMEDILKAHKVRITVDHRRKDFQIRVIHSNYRFVYLLSAGMRRGH